MPVGNDSGGTKLHSKSPSLSKPHKSTDPFRLELLDSEHSSPSYLYSRGPNFSCDNGGNNKLLTEPKQHYTFTNSDIGKADGESHTSGFLPTRTHTGADNLRVLPHSSSTCIFFQPEHAALITYTTIKHLRELLAPTNAGYAREQPIK